MTIQERTTLMRQIEIIIQSELPYEDDKCKDLLVQKLTNLMEEVH